MFSREKLGDFGFLGKIRVVQIIREGGRILRLGGQKKNFWVGQTKILYFRGNLGHNPTLWGRARKEGNIYYLPRLLGVAGQKYWEPCPPPPLVPLYRPPLKSMSVCSDLNFIIKESDYLEN